MSESLSKQRNASIDMFRYLCAVLVVAIHTTPLEEISSTVSYICSSVITVIAVPFFFAVAGYFFSRKLEQGERPLFPYLKKILWIYLISSVPYWMIDFVRWGYSNILSFAYNSAVSFLTTGSYYHFWFFPSLLLSACITAAFFRLRLQKALLPAAIVLYVIGCLGSSYYAVGIRIPFLQTLYDAAFFEDFRRAILTGFPMFVIGYAVHRLWQRHRARTEKNVPVLLVVCIVWWAAEMGWVHWLRLQRKVAITPALLPLVMFVLLFLLAHPLPRYAACARKCRAMANVTYYLHPFFMMVLSKICSVLDGSITSTIRFLIVTATTAVLGILLNRSHNRLIRSWIG